MVESEKDILKRYRKKVKSHAEEESISQSEIKDFSREYIKFREEALSKTTTKYENWCNSVENLIKIAPPKDLLPKLEASIEFTHLNITPVGAASFAIFISIVMIFLGIFIALISFLLLGKLSIFLPLVLLIVAIFIIKPLTKLPIYIEDKQRLAASNQMVLCILYIVMYMRHTSNLEHAIKFAAEHIEPPLSLDLRKIFWDIETGKFSTIKESIDNYLEVWRENNLEFLNSFHLIEASLYEPSEDRRITLLDKAMDVILEGTYEKMLRYTHDLKNPITMLHMMGVVLPILGLVVFPLIGSFLGGLVRWYHLAFLYNLILPSIIFFFGINILSKRPTGYGESKMSETLIKEDKNLFWTVFFILSLFLFLGFLPLILHLTNPNIDIPMGPLGNFLDYKEVGTKLYGPFGLGALLFSFFIPFAFAFAFGYYYRKKVGKLIEIRNETKNLEREFAASLFQLGNRIGDGIPTEMAFSTVAKNMEGTPSGNFFRIVDLNIRQLGMGIKEAIFNPKTGAITTYPSSLVQSSMEVLLESSKKGPKIVATSLISISNYVDRIHKVNERIKDLLAEIISSQKSQISFLTPAIAGIVVGIASMIVSIIVQLGEKFQQFSLTGEEFAGGASSQLNIITQLFGIEDIIPGFFFQLVVGIYVFQSIYILTILENGIENGTDKINEKYLLGKNLYKAVFLYIIIAAIVVILFNLLAQSILVGTEF